MSTLVSKIVPVLKRVRRLTPAKQKKIIGTCHNDILKCIGICVKHIINGKARLTSAQLKKLRRRKQLVRSLARKNTSLKSKRKILQTGGFLGLILPSVVSLMTTLLGKQ